MNECANRDEGKCLELPVEKIAFFNENLDSNGLSGEFWLCQKHLDQFMREQDIHENN